MTSTATRNGNGHNGTPIDPVIQEVLQDGRLAGVGHVAKQVFMEAHSRAAIRPAVEGEIVHELGAPEVTEAFKRSYAAAIAVEAAKLQLEAAKRHLKNTQDEISLAINAFEPYVASRAPLEIDFYKRALIDPALRRQRRSSYRSQLMGCVTEMTAWDEPKLQQAKNGHLDASVTATLEGAEVPEMLITDIAEFLIESGDRGKQLVAKVTVDPATAHAVLNDEESPLPLAAVATLALSAQQQTIQ